MAPVLVADNGNGSGEVPLGPVLSIFDPVHVGIDEFGHPVRVPMIYRNMLIGGEPGAGKSALLNAIVAHAALSLDCRLVLLDGKQVELGQWRKCADAFIGPNIAQALSLLTRLQIMMDRRYAYLLDCERRKIAPQDAFLPYVLACDEIAYFSATCGDRRPGRNSPPCCATWSRGAGRSASSSSPPPNDRPRTSSQRRCGICSRGGSRDAAPPTAPATSCWDRGGRSWAGPPTRSVRTTPARVC